jgi:putative phosphoesterase
MKFALIGDIHANLPALEAVLAHARAQAVEAVWNIGDFVGYGPDPDEVVTRVRQEKAISIAGNYDLKVLRFPKKKEKWSRTKKPEKFFAFQWAYEQLSPQNRAYLGSLPEEIRLEAGGKQILLTHGSPVSNEEHLEPDTPAERLAELARIAARAGAVNIIVCGHSHRGFARQEAGVWFINTGSVGRPDDGDPRACYAVLQLDPVAVTVQHYRLEYEVEKTVAAIRAKGLPEAFAQMLIQGRDLEGVQNV